MTVTTNSAVRERFADAAPQRAFRETYAAPIAVGLAFSALCIFLAKTLNIWQDEAYSLHTTAGGVANAWMQGITFEAQAPLYFALLALWRSVDASATHARLLSLAFSLITLYATWEFARRYLRIKPVLVLAAIAFNPFTVWAAVEIRPYAASIAFSAVLLLLFFRGFIDAKPSRAARFVFVAAAIAGTYTLYYVALLVPACGAALLVLRRWTALKGFIGGGIVFALALVPLIFVVPPQFHAYDAFAAAFKIPGYIMAAVLLEYPFPHDWIGSWAHMRLPNLIYIVVLSIPIAIAAASLRTLSVTSAALLSVVGALVVLYTAIITIAHVHVLVPRHSLVVLVPLVALIFALIGDCPPARRPLVLTSYLAVFAVFSALTYWQTYHRLAKTGDWQRVSAFITHEAQAGDPVALFTAETELPFRYYFHGKNTIAALPRPMSFESFDEEKFVLHSERDVASSLGRAAQSHARVWLVESNVCERQAEFFGCDYLRSYVRTHFIVMQTKSFDGATVVELKSLANPSR